MIKALKCKCNYVHKVYRAYKRGDEGTVVEGDDQTRRC